MLELGKLGSIFRGDSSQGSGETKKSGGITDMMSKFFPSGGAEAAQAAAPEAATALMALSDKNSKENVQESTYDTMRSVIGRKK